MKKVLFTCIFFLGLGLTVVSAQSQKMKEKATLKVEELNKQIMAADKSLALTDDQKTQVFDIHVARLIAVKKANKAGANKEEKKAINKKHLKKIFDEVLSKDQKKARKTGKAKLKE